MGSITPVVAGLALLLAACATSEPPVTPSPSPPVASVAPTHAPSPDLAAGAAARDAYIGAICPIFLHILAVDPRLASMRADGDDPTEVLTERTELAAVTVEVTVIINDLGRLPRWTAGAALQRELMTALHGVRVGLARVEQELDGPGAAAALREIPYLASARMDQAMLQAATAGLNCDGFE